MVTSNLMCQELCPKYYICPDNLVEGERRDEQAYSKAMKKAVELQSQGIY